MRRNKNDGETTSSPGADIAVTDRMRISITESLVLRKIQMRTAQSYRDQLDRVRRFLGRIESTAPRRDVDFQDDMWSFFQNCWHLKDWLKHDDLISEDLYKAIERDVFNSPPLIFSGGMANGTKHLLERGPGISAEHVSTDTRITSGESTVLDCSIDVGEDKPRSARALAKECVVEWERILTSHGLAIAQRS